MKCDNKARSAPVVNVVILTGGLTRQSQVGANPYPFHAQLIWRYLDIK